MSKPTYRTAEDEISFNIINKNVVEKLERDGDIKLPKKKLDIPKDKRWNTKQMSSKLLQGILNGDSIPTISKSLEDIVGTNKASQIRNARTMVTGAENAGRLDSYKNLEEQGVVMKKVWIATPDDRTRASHLEIDGEEVDIDADFSNGCACPGDPECDDPSEVWNCRCSMRTRIIGFRRPDGSISRVKHNRGKTLHDTQMEAEKEQRGVIEARAVKATSIGDLEAPKRPHREDFNGDEDAFQLARTEYRKQREEYNAKIDEAIQAVNRQTAFNSVDEAKDWAKNNGIKIDNAVFEQVDLRAFNEVKPALEEMFERFPEIKGYSFEYHDGNIYNTDFQIGLTSDGLLSANGGFNFNPRDFSTDNLDYGLKQAFDEIADGTLVRGDGSFETLVRHEYGHNVQSYIERKIADKYHYSVDDWRKNFDTFEEFQGAMDSYRAEIGQYRSELYALAKMDGASEYSGTNDRELFAEGFADYSSGGQSKFAKEFGKFLERWY